jgi:hypothetical protein
LWSPTEPLRSSVEAVRTAGDHEGRPYERTQVVNSMSFPTATPPDVQLAGPARVAPSHEAIAPLAAPAPVPPPLLAALAGLEPAAPPARRHDVTVVKRAKYGCARVMAVPPEEFGIARRARTLAEADYCFHAVRKAEHQLIAEGFDPEQVKALPSEGADDDPEAAARSSVDESAEASEGLNRSARMIEITEHYIRLDYEGDGRARLYRVVTGGGPDGEILRCRRSPDERVARIERQRNPGSPVPDVASLHPGYDDSDDDGETFKAAIEEVDVMPFAAMTPFPVPHRFTGRSAADQVVDIQKIKTALLRTLLDNAYASNMPRPIVSENGAGDNTLDDLLTWRHGAPIRVRGPIADAITWTQVPPIGAQLYPLMEYLDATREWRTGVTRQGQGIDANALANQSATAVNQMFTAAQGRMKLIARIFAETGIRDLFALLHHVIRKHDGRENTVRLRNRWVTVSPREWRTRENMTINVGLGTGGKQQQLANFLLIASAQEKAALQPQLAMVARAHIYESAKELCKLVGYKNAGRFFADPAETPPSQAAPNPKLEEMRARIGLEQLQAESELAFEQRKAEAAAAADAHKLQLELVLKREQMAAEMALRREQMLAELALERESLALQAAAPTRGRRRGSRAGTGTGGGLSPVRPGGRIG